MTDKVVVLNSASFWLHSNRDGSFTVMRTNNNRSGNAQAIVGRTFKPGDDPWAWPMGYACRIQQALNREG